MRVALTVIATVVSVARTDAQAWRDDAMHLGTTTRVLVVGTRPEDEDNALITWLGRGRHLETAVLSLTRGESGRNVTGAERDAPLAVVRTAEVLAERGQDGAHQYFTRAFDLGATNQDSAVARAWPRDSVLIDIVSVIRAFRPHVVILLNSSTDGDAVRRYRARLTTAAFAAAADTIAMPSRSTARLPAWTISQLFTRFDSATAVDTGLMRIDVGAFDRTTGRSYAELGAAIRQCSQRRC
jgi:hypothetical protein